ncbi:rod shape-determining protein [Microbispora sp. H11081]|uniref:rod shape-determining protein n=1 Tax=Microbispora sp. H11081 TaxID=2729107 RepID=UPI001473D316|nr:rod shape-determining protein [Microbispora sp. H11081]
MTALALDLGTARIRLMRPGSTAIEERPSACGDPGARRWPVRHGMVADMPGCARLVRTALRDVEADPHRPLERVLVGVPVAATRLDRRAAYTAVRSAVRCRVTMVEEPLAAAVGCGVDLADPRPRLLLDAGAGIAEAVVIRAGEIADAGAVQAGAGDPAEGAGCPPYARERVVAMVADLVARVPAALRAALRQRGLLITGGGARDPELARRLCADLRMTVSPAADPANATVRGLACLLSTVEHRTPGMSAIGREDVDDDHK